MTVTHADVYRADDYKKGAWRVVLRNIRGEPCGVRYFNGEHPERDARAYADRLREGAKAA